MTSLFDDLGLPTPDPVPVARPSADPALLLDDLNPEQRAAVRAPGEPAAHRRGCRVGQDPGAHPADRAPAGDRRRPARRDPRDHVHQQGRRRDARARRRAGRQPGAGDVGLHLPLRLRADPAQGGAAAGHDVVVLDLRRHRLPAPDDPRVPRPRPRPQALSAARVQQPGVQPQERADRPRDVHRPREQPPGEDPGRGLRRLPAPPPARQRVRLRRPDLVHRRRAPAVPRRRRALPPPVPPRARRRVPGHQPRAVRAGQRARRSRRRRGAAGAAVRGGRRGPEHLRLPRRHDPQHRGVRARLPERQHDPARAELPIDADHPDRGQRGDHPQHRAAGQAPVDRRRRRRADHRLRRRQRARRGRVRRG